MDSCPVEHLCPHFLAVVPTNLCQLVCQPDLSFLHPTNIGCLLQSLYNFLICLSSFLCSLQLCLQLQDLLFCCGQLYLNVIKLFALILSLVLGILQTGPSALLRPLLHCQLHCKLLVLLLSNAQGLVGLSTEVSLNLIPGILDPLLYHKNLLDNLHKIGRAHV